MFKEQEEEKKRKYQQRVLDVEMGLFTPLVFGTNGGMGNECQRFLKHLADKIAQKDTEPYHIVITWLRTQISFELLRSVHACVRGSRTPFRSKIEQSLDCKIDVASADIWNTRSICFLYLGRFMDTGFVVISIIRLYDFNVSASWNS